MKKLFPWYCCFKLTISPYAVGQITWPRDQFSSHKYVISITPPRLSKIPTLSGVVLHALHLGLDEKGFWSHCNESADLYSGGRLQSENDIRHDEWNEVILLWMYENLCIVVRKRKETKSSYLPVDTKIYANLKLPTRSIFLINIIKKQ